MNTKYIKRSCRWWTLGLLLMCTLTVQAQEPPQGKRPPFNPAKFEADLEQYITTNACLTPREAAAFFPLYRKMMKKMRSCFDEMKRYHHVNPKDNDACAEAIRRQDEADIEMKQLQQEYHQRFLLVLPANKVLAVIKAEEQFHRQAFKRVRK
jgi:hypothetical protein